MNFRFASRPVRAALAVKIAFAILAANAGLACAKAIISARPARIEVAASAMPVLRAIVPIEAANQDCREVLVQTDDGYGVRGQTARFVCRKAI